MYSLCDSTILNNNILSLRQFFCIVLLINPLLLHAYFFYLSLEVVAIAGGFVFDTGTVGVDGVGRVMQELGNLGTLVDA